MSRDGPENGSRGADASENGADGDDGTDDGGDGDGGTSESGVFGTITVGDTIYLEVEVIEMEPHDHPVGNGIVRYAIDAHNQRDETVLACEMLSLLH